MKENAPDDLVRAYLKGKLAQSELENFEKLFDSDPDLARAVALQRTEIAVSELLIASETRDLFKEWRTGNPPHRGFSGIRPTVWLAGIAAGLLLLAVAVWTFRRSSDVLPGNAEKPLPPPEIPVQSPEPTVSTPPTKLPPPGRPPKNYHALAAQHLPEPMLSNLRRSSPDSAVSIFRRAQFAYEAGNYQGTLDLLAQTDSSQLQSAAFLSAHALFRLQRFSEAEARFAQLIGLNSRQFRYQSEWGLLMCRIADLPKREKEVGQQLNEILARPEHPYFKQAKALQKTLKE